MFHKLPIVAVASLVVLIWAVNNASAAKVGEKCDGLVGDRCDWGLQCDPGPGQCWVAVHQGTCVDLLVRMLGNVTSCPFSRWRYAVFLQLGHLSRASLAHAF
jgi:hypothetical protein